MKKFIGLISLLCILSLHQSAFADETWIEDDKDIEEAEVTLPPFCRGVTKVGEQHTPFPQRNGT